MNCDAFNRNLAEISILYRRSQQNKLQLKKLSSQQIIEYLNYNQIEAHQQNGGFVCKSTILEWINQVKKAQNYKHAKYSKNKSLQTQLKRMYSIEQLTEVFPFGNKISYTALLSTCLSSVKSSAIQQADQDKIGAKQNTNFDKTTNMHTPLQLITSIIQNQVKIRQFKKQIIPMIELYIPMTQKNLTLQELKDYLLIGQSSVYEKNQINPHHIILALNGNDNSSYLEFQFYSTGKNKEDCKQNQTKKQQENQSQIEQIMKRLNARVDNFGKQWLINKTQVTGSQKLRTKQ